MEVKFRWVGRNRKFDKIQINEGLTTNDLLRGSYLSFFSESNRGEGGNCEFLSEDMCTGFLDKNRKEVYENDIVTAWSQGYKGTFRIHFRKGGAPMFILYPANQNGEFWNIHTFEYKKGKQLISVSGILESTLENAFVDDGIEIIGNIYENPELMPKHSAINI